MSGFIFLYDFCSKYFPPVSSCAPKHMQVFMLTVRYSFLILVKIEILQQDSMKFRKIKFQKKNNISSVWADTLNLTGTFAQALVGNTQNITKCKQLLGTWVENKFVNLYRQA
jgi:hypothetical protein